MTPREAEEIKKMLGDCPHPLVAHAMRLIHPGAQMQATMGTPTEFLGHLVILLAADAMDGTERAINEALRRAPGPIIVSERGVHGG